MYSFGDYVLDVRVCVFPVGLDGLSVMPDLSDKSAMRLLSAMPDLSGMYQMSGMSGMSDLYLLSDLYRMTTMTGFVGYE